MSNPRNTTTNTTTNGGANGSFDPDSWKSMGLGSASLRDGKDLVRNYDMSFVINPRNAEFIRDAAQYVLDNPTDADGKEQRVSINFGTFFDLESVNDKVKKFFSHRIYVTADTVAKIGKKISDYVKDRNAA